MKMRSVLFVIAPAAATAMFVGSMGLMVLLPALLIEALCLFGLRRTAPGRARTALCAAMETGMLLAAMDGRMDGSVRRKN